jgi:hypothetical protein
MRAPDAIKIAEKTVNNRSWSSFYRTLRIEMIQLRRTENAEEVFVSDDGGSWAVGSRELGRCTSTQSGGTGGANGTRGHAEGGGVRKPNPRGVQENRGATKQSLDVNTRMQSHRKSDREKFWFKSLIARKLNVADGRCNAVPEVFICIDAR